MPKLRQEEGAKLYNVKLQIEMKKLKEMSRKQK